MAAHKTSAVADEPIHVLFALHPKFDLLDLSGPLKVFTTALHDAKDPSETASPPPPPEIHLGFLSKLTQGG